MRDPSEIRDAILAELPEDYVGLWWIPKHLREDFGVSNAEELRVLTLDLAASVLSEPGVVFGQFSGGEFHHWNESAIETLARIEREWQALGREPNIGDIGWFDLGERPSANRRPTSR